MSVKPLNHLIVEPAGKTAGSSMRRFNDATIIITSRQRTKKINTRSLKQIVGGLLAELEITEAELGINLVGALEMIRVNETFLQHEGSTDVITFSYANSEFRTQNSEPELHGELFVCVDDAITQAKQFGTSWQSEVVRYVVHGVLHLLGHEDMRPPRRRRMKREENRLVRLLAKKFSLAQIGAGPKLRA
jgi:probable rRNA maturation factor